MVSQLPNNCTYAAFYFAHLTKLCDFTWQIQVEVPNSRALVNQCHSERIVSLFTEPHTRRKHFVNMSGLSGGVFRPRGALARALYDKQVNDGKLRQLNKSDWYKIDKSALSPSALSRYCQLQVDHATRQFISKSIEKSSWIWSQMWHLLATSLLGLFWTRTDINGWLGRGSMFILSLEQLSMLLDLPETDNKLGGAMIDLGAGDGAVTKDWAPIFDSIYATEVSTSMRNLLTEKGFVVLDIDTWHEKKFKTVCMLNLLDRCSHPLTMLMNAKKALTDDGIIIAALVLPFKPYVETNKDHKPEEILPLTGDTFEEQVESFIEFADTELDLELSKWTRVPYLCEGDINQSYYWLDDVIFILRKKQ